MPGISQGYIRGRYLGRRWPVGGVKPQTRRNLTEDTSGHTKTHVSISLPVPIGWDFENQGSGIDPIAS